MIFSDVLDQAQQDGANVVIDIGINSELTLDNVTLSSLSETDFIY